MIARNYPIASGEAWQRTQATGAYTSATSTDEDTSGQRAAIAKA